MAAFATCVDFWIKRKYLSKGTLMHKILFSIILLTCIVFTSGQQTRKSICDNTVTKGYTLKLIQSPGTQDCVCKITKKVPVTVLFTIQNLTCDVDNQPWKVKFYSNGCGVGEYTCTVSWDGFQMKSVLANPHVIDLHLFKYWPQSQWIFYDIDILAVITEDIDAADRDEILEVQCGFTSGDIDQKDYTVCNQATTTTPVTTTTTSTTSTTPTVSTSRSTSTTVLPNNDDNTDEPLLSTPILIAIIAGGSAVVIVTIILIFIAARRRQCPKKDATMTRNNLVPGDEDNQSQYSYAREIPGSGKKNLMKHQKKLLKEKEDAASTKSSERPLKSKPKIVPNGDISDKSYPGEKTLPGPAIYVTDSWWQDKQKQNKKALESNSSTTLPMQDIYAKASKKDKKKSVGQMSHLSHITTNSDGEVPYTYFNRIVDDEFSFINNDMYSGHLGF